MSVKLKTGWLSPTGEFFPCKPYEHVKLAQELTRHPGYSDELLLDKGWVQISVSAMKVNMYHIFWHGRLSVEQIRFLRPYFDGTYGRVPEYTMERWIKEIENN